MEEIIKKYLEERAKTDESVAANLKKENKNIKDCCKYITEQARKAATNNVAMIADEVVYGWAVHYYDEDKLEEEQPKPKAKAVKVIVPAEKKEKAKNQGKQEKPAEPKKPAKTIKRGKDTHGYIQCDLFGEFGM